LAQPKNIALVVPGIMASCLRSRSSNKDLWTEDFRGNYKRMLNPAVFRFHGESERAQATAILKDIRLPVLRLSIKSLYGKVLTVLKKHPRFQPPGGVIEFPYDWRGDLVVTAELLGKRLRRELGPDPDKWHVTPITHSMGGLVVQIAIANDDLPPAGIDKIVHIASPFKGSASAFKSLFDFLDFPLIEALFDYEYGKDARLAKQVLRGAMQTFPSVYQLLPPESEAFIDSDVVGSFSPLGSTQKVMHDDMKAAAKNAHEAIAKSMGLLRGTNKVRVVRGVYPGRPTPERYKAHVWPDRYELKQPVPVQSTIQGDGTVTGRSAVFEGAFSDFGEVVGAEHAFMCNHPRVAELVEGLV
jgi:hypothetical protein